MCFDMFFFKQKTAYEMRISDWSSDVCSSDLDKGLFAAAGAALVGIDAPGIAVRHQHPVARHDVRASHLLEARLSAGAGAGLPRRCAVAAVTGVRGMVHILRNGWTVGGNGAAKENGVQHLCFLSDRVIGRSWYR